jgi:hypothetical protein
VVGRGDPLEDARRTVMLVVAVLFDRLVGGRNGRKLDWRIE